MPVYIANFGRGNYAWDRCRENATVATMNDEALQPFWLVGDKDGYTEYCQANRRTVGGDRVPTQLASRWFNLMTIVAGSAGDLWVHRDGDQIWWTRTTEGVAVVDTVPREVPYQNTRVFECHKPCLPWSMTNANGAELRWNGLHPKAHDFLTTESTLQELSADYAGYVRALIADQNLDPWHNLPEWKAILLAAKVQPVRSSTSVEKSIVDMAYQAEHTAKTSNGQKVESIAKVKLFEFGSRQELEDYLKAMLTEQNERCKLSGLPLQFKGSETDPQMLCSLDRIDSDGHYERGNLQIVCRFVNFWKNNMNDEEFRRLLAIIRRQDA